MRPLQRPITGTQWTVFMLCVMCVIMWGTDAIKRTELRRRIGDLEASIEKISHHLVIEKADQLRRGSVE